MKLPGIVNQSLTVIGGMTVAVSMIGLLLYLVLPSLAPTEEERFRLPSPDKKYDAVVTIEQGQMAFGSHHFKVYIKRHNTADKNDFEIFRAPNLNIGDIAWLSPKLLQIVRPPDQEIEYFRSTAVYPDTIHIQLITKERH